MKISELIEQLKNVQDELGDVNVELDQEYAEEFVKEDDGNPQNRQIEMVVGWNMPDVTPVVCVISPMRPLSVEDLEDMLQ